MKRYKTQPLPNTSKHRTFPFVKPHSGPSLARPAFPSTSKMNETRQGEMVRLISLAFLQGFPKPDFIAFPLSATATHEKMM